MHKRWPKHFPFILASLPLLWLLLTAAAYGGSTTTGSTTQDPAIPHIQQQDRGWVDTTNTVDTTTLEALRKVSDRFLTEGFQLAGAFFSNIASDPSQFASDFGNQNGIGSSTKDNGLVMIVLLDRAGTDGNKPYIFVAPGRGLGGLLNDAKVTRFREAYFNPLRAQGKWQEGLIQLTNKFAGYLKTPSATEFSDESLQQIANDAAPSWPTTLLGLSLIVLSIRGFIALIKDIRRFIAWVIEIFSSRGSDSSTQNSSSSSSTQNSSSSSSIWASSSSSSSWDNSSSSSSWGSASYGGGGSFDGGGSGG